MKQIIFIPILSAAAALSLLAFVSSCAKVSIDKPDQAEQYIDFSTSVETKAPVESSAGMDEFAVWAYRSDDALSLPEEEMHGIHVYPSSNGNWVYDNIRMWTDGIWHFEAMYPDPNTLGQALIGVDFYIPKSEGQAEMDGVSISYFDGTKADVDLMLAKADRTYSSTAPDARAVSLKFEHLLSRVGIAVKTTTEDLTLTSLTFKGMGVIGAYNTNESGEDKWMLLNSVPELESVISTGTFKASLDGSPLLSDGTAVDVLSDLLLIPQTPGTGAGGQQPMTVDVTYTVGSGGAETKTLTIPADPVWDPGSRYRYTLTLGTADVTLNIDVAEWDEENYSVRW